MRMRILVWTARRIGRAISKAFANILGQLAIIFAVPDRAVGVTETFGRCAYAIDGALLFSARRYRARGDDVAFWTSEFAHALAHVCAPTHEATHGAAAQALFAYAVPRLKPLFDAPPPQQLPPQPHAHQQPQHAHQHQQPQQQPHQQPPQRAQADSRSSHQHQHQHQQRGGSAPAAHGDIPRGHGPNGRGGGGRGGPGGGRQAQGGQRPQAGRGRGTLNGAALQPRYDYS
ncbi:hypothetical protein M885DRAFT_618074 [Pelagophyceae sp. CCMP2097]|nr:hypothetical protein M885DRAFT_618074 [Pelagophyceae sp. CCMP2097]